MSTTMYVSSSTAGHRLTAYFQHCGSGDDDCESESVFDIFISCLLDTAWFDHPAVLFFNFERDIHTIVYSECQFTRSATVFDVLLFLQTFVNISSLFPV